MMDSRTTLSQALHSLQARGLARLDAQLLLLHVLGLAPTQRGWLLAHDTDLLPATCTAVLEALAQRRLADEPLAYLTGTKSFFRLDLHVNPSVLVPRPDTETLVDWALELLQYQPVGQLLDLGTGSGAVALALKSSQPAWQVWATDISPAALAVAQANAQHLNLPVHLREGAWFAALPVDTPRFDYIVSNPPYIAEHDPHLHALRFEPEQALTSGPDGLRDLRLIITGAPRHLKTGGWLLLEHGYDQADAVCKLLQSSGFVGVQSRHDLVGISRCSAGQWAA
jgi:release factor glutamine methyltransferase